MAADPNGATAAPSGELTLVFTDVQGSTQLWERQANGMRRALQLHNDLLRALLVSNQGYEVKTEGDALMVAFADPVKALSFGLAAQEALLAQPWPSELLEDESAAEVRAADGTLLFRGLRVRIGIHHGKPEQM